LYEHLSGEFEQLLKTLYKDSSFTSFLRFVLPNSTPEHQYLAFIRYNIDNSISDENLDQVRLLLRDYHEK
jgi:hypothetical protein